jgi:hypothetical protein
MLSSGRAWMQQQQRQEHRQQKAMGAFARGSNRNQREAIGSLPGEVLMTSGRLPVSKSGPLQGTPYERVETFFPNKRLNRNLCFVGAPSGSRFSSLVPAAVMSFSLCFVCSLCGPGSLPERWGQ